MKFPAWLLLMLLAAAPAWAKPKIDVKLKVFNGIGRDRVSGALTKNGSTPSNTNDGMLYERVFYFNVTLTTEKQNAALAKNNGQWCISGDAELNVDDLYDATLDGNNLEIEITAKNGKSKKYRYVVIDRQWRKLDDFR
jgi:hypothetical protein